MAEKEKKKREKKSSLWLLACLVMIVFGCITGLFSLALGIGNLSFDIFLSYFKLPVLLLFNVLPSVLLHLAFYMLFGRPWLAFFFGSGIVLGAGALQGFKIWLQEDVFYLSDLLPGGSRLGFLPDISGVSLNWVMIGTLIYFVFGVVFLIVLFRRRKAPWLAGRLVAMVVFLCLFYPYWLEASNVEKYAKYTDNSAVVTDDSELMRYVSKGFLYPFVQTADSSGEKKAPGGYQEKKAASMLGAYEASDIPSGRAFDLFVVQLKNFTDLSNCSLEGADLKYAYTEYEKLKENAFWGRLYALEFPASGIEGARSFLTGTTGPGVIRRNTNSYIWYLRAQGYRTWGIYPKPLPAGSRGRTYGCLGLEDLIFKPSDEGGSSADADASDWWMFGEVLAQYKKKAAEASGSQFAFMESTQNGGVHKGLSGLQDYLDGVKDTLFYVSNLAEQLEALQKPAVLLVYGDGSPDLGSDVYNALGLETELDTPQTRAVRSSSEYLIWMNSAAKQALGDPKTGKGPDISLNYLMAELFSSLGWGGPGFMKASQELQQLLPVVSPQGFCSKGGEIISVPQLSLDEQSRLHNYEYVEYYWTDHFGLIK
ncbi:MAG: hypothetical protein IJM39_00755 [Firmicutes bacterium]|nr:hypothetical protein [Bacillota bacterium]